MKQLMPNDYPSIIRSLKEKIRVARLKTTFNINKELLHVYWEIGDTILKQQTMESWGTKVIDRLSSDLITEFPDLKGLSVRNLKYMRAFAEAWPEFRNVQVVSAQNTVTDFQAVEFVQGALAQLTWYHHVTLLDKVRDHQQRLFYIQKTIENGWSRDVMVYLTKADSGNYDDLRFV